MLLQPEVIWAINAKDSLCFGTRFSAACSKLPKPGGAALRCEGAAVGRRVDARVQRWLSSCSLDDPKRLLAVETLAKK